MAVNNHVCKWIIFDFVHFKLFKLHFPIFPWKFNQTKRSTHSLSRSIKNTVYSNFIYKHFIPGINASDTLLKSINVRNETKSENTSGSQPFNLIAARADWQKKTPNARRNKKNANALKKSLLFSLQRDTPSCFSNLPVEILPSFQFAQHYIYPFILRPFKVFDTIYLRSRKRLSFHPFCCSALVSHSCILPHHSSEFLNISPHLNILVTSTSVISILSYNRYQLIIQIPFFPHYLFSF